MKNEKPTPLELAQLAAQLHPKTGAERESIKQAMTLWTEAERELDQVQHRADYLRELVAVSYPATPEVVPVIYSATPEDWKIRIEKYPGDRADIDRELLKCVPADKVHQALFRDKNIKKETRRTLFVGLLKFAQKQNMAPPPRRTPKEVEAYLEETDWSDGLQIDTHDGLGGDELMLRIVRWAAEVRQRQIAANNTRIMPQSLKQKRKQPGDSIQFKPKIRA
jgi:hypothetical protein